MRELLKRPEGKFTIIASIIIALYVVAIIKYKTVDNKLVHKTKKEFSYLFETGSIGQIQPVDVYVNYNGEYSGKISYMVSSGFKGNEIIYQDMGNYLLIKYPYPKILYTARISDLKLIKPANQIRYYEGMLKYGLLEAKYYALKNGILQKTIKQTEKFLSDYSKNVGIEVKNQFPEETKQLWNRYYSSKCKIYLDIPKDYDTMVIKNKDGDLSPFCFVGFTKRKSVSTDENQPDNEDDRKSYITFYIQYAPLNSNQFPKNQDLRQYSLINPENIYSMQEIDLNVSKSEDKYEKIVRFYFKRGFKTLIIDVIPKDEASLQTYIGDVMFIASLVHFTDEKFDKNADCFGTTPDVWNRFLLGDKQRYITKYFLGLKFYKTLPKGVFFYDTHLILTTKEGRNYAIKMLEKLSKVSSREEIRGHLLFSVLGLTGKNFDKPMLWVFLDNGKIIGLNYEGKRRDFSYQALIDASLETTDLGYICLSRDYCLGSGELEEFIPDKYKKQYLYERNLAKVIWRVASYGFPKFYSRQ